MSYISKVRLINCQSMKDMVFEFSPSLNIIKADGNSYGKSIFYKIVRESLTPGYYDAVNLIRHGSDHLELIVLFSDGCKNTFRLYHNHREYVYVGEDQIPRVTRKPSTEYVRGMSALISGDYFANMICSQSDLLFVSTSSKLDTEFLSLLTSNEKMENIIEYTAEKSKDYNSKSKLIDVEKSRVSREIANNPRKGTSGLRYDIEFLEAFTPFVEILEILEGFLVAGKIVRDKESICEKLLDLVKTLEVMDSLDRFSVSKRKVRSIPSELSRLVDLSMCLEHIVPFRDCSQVVDTLNMISIIDSTSQLSVKSDDVADVLSLVETVEKVDDIFHCVKKCTEYLALEKHAEQDLDNLRDTIKEEGTTVVCPYYGEEVLFDEKGCIPSN